MVNIKLIHILECQENFFISLSNEIVLHVFQAGWRQLIFFLIYRHCSVSILMQDSLYGMFIREQAMLKSGSSLNADMPYKLIKVHFRPFIKGGCRLSECWNIFLKRRI